MRRAWLLATAVAMISGCTHSVHVNHTSDYRMTQPISAHTRVTAKAEQRVVLGFSGNTDYVDQAFSELQSKCPDGRLSGIQTRYSTSHGFMSWTNVILMKGYCG